MSCYCNPCNPCGPKCEHKDDCEFLKLDWVPHASCTLSITDGSRSDTLDLCPGVRNCQTTTHMNFNNQTGCIEFQNEKYIYSDGMEEGLERVCVGDFLPFINLTELNDVEFDNHLDGNCYELIFKRDNACGPNCRPINDKWFNWNINTDGAKADSLTYVRGAYEEGCPVYLDIPEPSDEYWFSGWRGNNEFGYYQATPATLPKDENGATIVMSQDPDTKAPIVGPLPINKWIQNVINNLAMEVETKFNVIQETPAFSGYTNPVTGDFTINWSDWYNTGSGTIRCGYGVISGKVNWTQTFNLDNGNVNYHINSVYFDKVVYTVDQGYTGPDPIYLTIKGVAIPGGQETTILDAYSFLPDHSWTETLDTTIPCDQTISVAPGQSVGPFNFAYLLTDWTLGDDEGYMQITYKNKLIGWEN